MSLSLGDFKSPSGTTAVSAFEQSMVHSGGKTVVRHVKSDGGGKSSRTRDAVVWGNSAVWASSSLSSQRDVKFGDSDSDSDDGDRRRSRGRQDGAHGGAAGGGTGVVVQTGVHPGGGDGMGSQGSDLALSNFTLA